MSGAAPATCGWLALGIALAGCAAPGARPLPDGATACSEPRPQICTMQYDPVCGLHPTGARQIYSNACVACADPAVIALVPGACGE